MLADSVPDSNPMELLLWLLRLRRRVRVDGASMIPTLVPGDEVLVDTRAYEKRAPVVGDIVVARRPDRQDVVLVKRVAAQLADGRFVLQGDNPTASTDSRAFGAVTADDLLGKVTSRFA
jgi:nickel-type superoxide dismutase maturation protease